jgi:phosphoglycolate phosphatase
LEIKAKHQKITGNERNLMAYKAIIFDLDGTLLNTLEDLTNSMNRVLTKEGFPIHPLDAYRYFVGNGATMLVTRTLPPENRDDETIRRCLKMFLEDYNQNWNIKTKPYKGVPGMLDALAARGLKMAVLTNKPDNNAKSCVAELLSNWNFEMVLGQRDGLPRKPDPAGALEIAEIFQIAPSEILYLGDTAVDMQTALAAQMFPVGALWGFRPQKELQENGAQAFLKQPMDILALLGT